MALNTGQSDVQIAVLGGADTSPEAKPFAPMFVLADYRSIDSFCNLCETPSRYGNKIMCVGRDRRARNVRLASGDAFSRRDPFVIGDQLSFPLDMFSVPHHYKGDVKEIMIPHGLVIDRIQKLAKDIRHDYADTTIHLLCVLKGGSAYFQDLITALRRFHDHADHSYVPFTFDFIKVKSYKGVSSTGSVQITGGDLAALEGKNVLVVEDIIDTGLTMESLLPVLEARGANSVRVTSLLEKRTELSSGFRGHYVGFSIPDKFVVGYCLDFNEFFRDMDHICVISDRGIERFTEETRG